MLLDMAGDDERLRERCVSMFRCLREFKETHFLPRPNFAHYFVVLSAYNSRLPVFTVNFDAMFEQACEELGLSYEVYRANDAGSFELRDGIVSICKPHGDIGFLDDGPISPDQICTTEVGISRITQWAQVITRLMDKHDLAFIGYSGRDVDLYPFMCEKARAQSDTTLFWINRFGLPGDAAEQGNLDASYRESSIELHKAFDCNAVVVEGYPSEVFPACISSLMVEKNEWLEFLNNAQLSSPSRDSELVKARDGALRKCADALPRFNQELLCLKILVQWQRNGVAERFYLEHRDEMLGAGVSELELISLRTTIARERADFISYGHLARRRLSLLKGLKSPAASAADMLWSRGEIVSAYQMRIPGFDTSEVPMAPWMTLLAFLYAMYVDMRFWLIKRDGNRVRKEASWISRAGEMSEGASGSLERGLVNAAEEIENRHLALEYRIADAVPMPSLLRRHALSLLDARLLALGKEARACCNNNTVKGVVRRIAKRNLENRDGFRELIDRNREMFDTFPDESQRSGMIRDEGSVSNRAGADEASRLYEVIEIARKTGNRLNEVKALVKLVGCMKGPERRDVLKSLGAFVGNRDFMRGIGFLNRMYLRRFRRLMSRRSVKLTSF